MSFKGVCSDVPQNSVRDAICPRFSDNMYENFDFPTLGENLYRNRKFINRPLTGRNRRRGGRCVDYKGDYKVWTEAAKYQELIL